MKKNECSAVVCRGRCVFMVEYTDITHELIHRAIDRGTRTGKAADSSIQFDPPAPYRLSHRLSSTGVSYVLGHCEAYTGASRALPSSCVSAKQTRRVLLAKLRRARFHYFQSCLGMALASPLVLKLRLGCDWEQRTCLN